MSETTQPTSRGISQPMYHGTSSFLLPKILGKGLSNPFLCDSPGKGSYYAQVASESVGGNPVVFRIPPNRVDASRLRYDKAAMDEPVMADDEARDDAWGLAAKEHPEWVDDGFIIIPPEAWEYSWDSVGSVRYDGVIPIGRRDVIGDGVATSSDKVLYHGTQSQKGFAVPSPSLDGGIHLGTQPQANMRSRGKNQRIIPIKTRFDKLMRSRDTGGNWASKIQNAKKKGFDGIVYLNRYEGVSFETVLKAQREGIDLDQLTDIEFKKYVPEAEDSYIAFHPDQLQPGDTPLEKEPLVLTQTEQVLSSVNANIKTASSGIGDVISRAFRTNAVMDVLTNQSVAQSGPFDGGCLIVAKALQLIVGGNLVRIASDINDGQTEHYGLRVGGVIYDADGAYRSSDEWISHFAEIENIKDRTLSFAEGYDGSSEIPDDPKAAKTLASVLNNILQAKKMAIAGHDVKTTNVYAAHWGKAGSGVLFFCPEDKTCLLILRSAQVLDPGVWGVPGGAVKGTEGMHETGSMEGLADEDFWSSAQKEVEEELGHLPSCDKVLGQIDYVQDGFTYRTFIVVVPKSEKNNILSMSTLNWESDAVDWFPIDNLPKNLHHGVRHVIQQWEKSASSTTGFLHTDPENIDKTAASSSDNTYMKAVQKGDMETAQKIIDETAKANGYLVGPVYHGTTSGPIASFDLGRAGRNMGEIGAGIAAVMFTDSYEIATSYASPGNRMQSDSNAYNAMQSLIAGREQYEAAIERAQLSRAIIETQPEGWEYTIIALDSWGVEYKYYSDYVYDTQSEAQEAADKDIQSEVIKREQDLANFIAKEDKKLKQGSQVVKAYLRMESPVHIDYGGKTVDMVDISQKIRAAQKAKKDGLILSNAVDSLGQENQPSTIYVVFSPSQIKSAEPVTYGKGSDVMLPSRRFDSSSHLVTASVHWGQGGHIKTARYGGAEQERSIWYHGTRGRNLQSVLVNGLIPDPKQREWSQDSHSSFYGASRASLGGIYVTQNLMTAISAANKSRNRKGGEPAVIVIMDIQPRSLMADEDVLMPVQNALSPGEPNEWLVAGAFMARELGTGMEYVEGVRSKYVESNVDYARRRLKGSLSPQAETRLRVILRDMWDAALDRQAAYSYHGDDYRWRQEWYRNVSQEQQKAVDAEMEKAGYDRQSDEEINSKIYRDVMSRHIPQRPDSGKAESVFAAKMDKLTRMLKNLSRPGVTGESFMQNGRSLDPIGFSGSNKITGIVEVSVVEGIYREEVRLVWGEMPSKFVEDWKKSVGELMIAEPKSQGKAACVQTNWLKTATKNPKFKTGPKAPRQTSSVSGVYLTVDRSMANAYANGRVADAHMGANTVVDGVIFGVILDEDTHQIGGDVWKSGYEDEFRNDMKEFLSSGKMGNLGYQLLEEAGINPPYNLDVIKSFSVEPESILDSIGLDRWSSFQGSDMGYSEIVIPQLPWKDVAMVYLYDSKGRLEKILKGGSKLSEAEVEEAALEGRLFWHGSPRKFWRKLGDVQSHFSKLGQVPNNVHPDVSTVKEQEDAMTPTQQEIDRLAKLLIRKAWNTGMLPGDEKYDAYHVELIIDSEAELSNLLWSLGRGDENVKMQVSEAIRQELTKLEEIKFRRRGKKVEGDPLKHIKDEIRGKTWEQAKRTIGEMRPAGKAFTRGLKVDDDEAEEYFSRLYATIFSAGYSAKIVLERSPYAKNDGTRYIKRMSEIYQGDPNKMSDEDKREWGKYTEAMWVGQTFGYGNPVPKSLEVYRGVSRPDAVLRPGDHVTTNRSYARGYMRGKYGAIIRDIVSSDDLIVYKLEDYDHDEFVYFPREAFAKSLENEANTPEVKPPITFKQFWQEVNSERTSGTKLESQKDSWNVSLECVCADDFGSGAKDNPTVDDQAQIEQYNETVEAHQKLQALCEARGIRHYIADTSDRSSRHSDAYLYFPWSRLSEVVEILKESGAAGDILDVPSDFPADQEKLAQEHLLWTVERGYPKGDGSVRTASAKPIPPDLMEARAEIAKSAQSVVDEWVQDKDGMDNVYGAGGPCDEIARAIGSILAGKGYDIDDGGQEGDDHAFVIASRDSRSFIVDIPSQVYETGGGYVWRKREGISILPQYVIIEEIDFVKTASTNSDREYPVAAAVVADGRIFEGRSHIEAIQQAIKAGYINRDEHQDLIDRSGNNLTYDGSIDLFRTNKGRLITRFEAYNMHEATGSEYIPEEEIDTLEKLLEKHNTLNALVYDDGKVLYLQTLSVPRDMRKQGLGTAFMNDLCSYADRVGKMIQLNLGDKAPGETTSKGRLIDFYKRFDFVRNFGRTKDYSLSCQMYRKPKVKTKKTSSVERPIAPVVFKFMQPSLSGDIPMFNLLRDIPGHPKGSTVSSETLIEAGYAAPSIPASASGLSTTAGDLGSQTIAPPPIVYHGTSNRWFSRFEPVYESMERLIKDLGITDERVLESVRKLRAIGPLFFFTEDIESAQQYAKYEVSQDVGPILKAKLSINNPMQFESKEEAIIALGQDKCDGARFYEAGGKGGPSHWTWVVKSPDQIEVLPREKVEGRSMAPAVFQGIQYHHMGNIPLFNLTEDIPGHPVGSTVSDHTLEEAGYEVPPIPAGAEHTVMTWFDKATIKMAMLQDLNRRIRK